jgi:hypothetical protein
MAKSPIVFTGLFPHAPIRLSTMESGRLEAANPRMLLSDIKWMDTTLGRFRVFSSGGK